MGQIYHWLDINYRGRFNPGVEQPILLQGNPYYQVDPDNPLNPLTMLNPEEAQQMNSSDWGAVDFLRQTKVFQSLGLISKPFLDVRRPVILDMSNKSDALTASNTGLNDPTQVANLPNTLTSQHPNTMTYGEIEYNMAVFGLLCTDNDPDANKAVTGLKAYSAFPLTFGGTWASDGLPTVSSYAEIYLTGGLSPSASSVIGDSLIPARYQTFTTLPGFPQPADPTNNPNTIQTLDNTWDLSVHTDAPSRVEDLLKQLRLMAPGWFP